MTPLSVLTVLSLLPAVISDDYTNCSTDITVLEKALFRPDNIAELNRVFYPPREASTRFIFVEYEFEDTNCTVTYIWAIGGFLLMQPPKIFLLTSLYFSTPANELNDLKLNLPKDCRPLVSNNGNNCTCASNDSSILDILTQQLNVYAKFNRPERAIRDTSSHVQAICDEELKSDYYRGVHTRLLMVCSAVIPFFFIAALIILIRSMHKVMNYELSKPKNHGNFAALVLMGVFCQWVIMGMDIAAVIYVFTRNYEYRNYQLQHSVNLFITAILLAFDSAIGLIQLSYLMYLWCILCHRETKSQKALITWCLEKCCPHCMIPCFYAIFGYDVTKKKWIGWRISKKLESINGGGPIQLKQEECKENQRTMWVMLIMLAAPLFSIGSHSAYILISWLIQPSSTTSTALVTIAIILYVFLLTRQCYMANTGSDLGKNCCKICGNCWFFFCLLLPLYQLLKHCFNLKQLCNDHRKGTLEESNHLLPKVTDEHTKFDLQAFFITFGWAILIVASVALTVVAFYEMPFKTLDLVSYLLNVFQIFIVIIALLITYKVFSLGDPEFLRFFKRTRETYLAIREKKTRDVENNTDEYTKKIGDRANDDLEASGIMTGRMIEVLIHGPKPKSASSGGTGNGGGQPASPGGTGNGGGQPASPGGTGNGGGQPASPGGAGNGGGQPASPGGAGD